MSRTVRRRRKPIKKLNIKMRRKLVGLFIASLLALVGLSLRITFINASSGEKYRKQVLSQSQQQYDSRVIPYKRGDILDRNGTVLATSNKVYNVILDCKVVNSKADYLEPTVEALTGVLGLEEEAVRETLTGEETRNSQYQIIQKAINMDQKKDFEKATSVDEELGLSKAEKEARKNIKGVWFEEIYKRSYPLNSLACDTIGFTFEGNLADYGIESYYNSTLNGVDGRQYGYFNQNSSVEQNIIEPTNGQSVVSTIDVGVQQIVDKWIQAFMDKMGGKDVGVIVMDPNNGEILAMGTQDEYDLNDPRDLSSIYTPEQIAAMNDEETVEALNDMWSNFCITDGYEPGSVVKPIVVGSALESGSIAETDTFVCDGGQSFGDSTNIKCTGTHGSEQLLDVIANSCNDAMMQIGAKMGEEQFVESQNSINFGVRTGIDLPNEGTGILHTLETMGPVELACSAFGQGYTCTMIQEIAAMSAVINGGNYYQPHVVNKILNSDGSVAKTISPNLLKQTVSSNISANVRSYMEASVTQGTSKYSKVQGYSSGGKTGTAEKQPRGNNKYLVSFIGFAPVEKPEVLIYVVVDEPKADRQDNSAYPQYIAQAIMSEVLPYLNVTPDEVEEGGAVPTTELWENFRGVKSSLETNENLLGEGEALLGEDGLPLEDGESAVDESEGSFEGTNDINIPAPLEEDENAPQENLDEIQGITNEEAEMGW